MEKNDREIWLLKNDPGELLISLQDLITIIVRKYSRLGYLPNRDAEDLIQEVNRSLLERLPKIQLQYNGKSKLRTYFSVIIRNICLEEIRKKPGLEEPQAPDYHKLDQAELPMDIFLIRQEYERFEKVLRLLFKDRARFVVMLRYMLDLKIAWEHILDLFSFSNKKVIEVVLLRLNSSKGMTKKAKFEQLSKELSILEEHYTSPDSLRKWFVTRSKDCLTLMNGNPPRSAYTLESLQFLLEKHESVKNDE